MRAAGALCKATWRAGRAAWLPAAAARAWRPLSLPSSRAASLPLPPARSLPASPLALSRARFHSPAMAAVSSESQQAETAASIRAGGEGREGVEEGRGGGAGEEGGKGEGRKILVAVDDSLESMEALRWAAKNIARPSDTIVLLHAQRIPQLPAAAVAAGSISTLAASAAANAFQTELLYEESRSKELLAAWKDYCTAMNVKAEVMMRMGEPGDVICVTGEQLNADVIVIGSHGYGTLKRCDSLPHPPPTSPPSEDELASVSMEGRPSLPEMHDAWALMGSVSDYCVHHAKCPVVVVKKQPTVT